MNHTFSFIIPCFNRQKYITRAVFSVLTQTDLFFELIVVDDGSTDSSVEEIKKISDSRLRLISIPKNKGNAHARNIGWKESKGDWIIFLDSDDWFEKNYLEELKYSIQKNPSVDFFWSGIRFVNEANEVLKEEFWEPRECLPSTTFFDELRIGTNCGIAISRLVFDELGGFNESFLASVDREFFLRVSQKVDGKGIDKILVNSLLGNHISVRKNYNAQFEAYKKLIETHSEIINFSFSRKRWWYHKAMWLGLYSHNYDLAFKFLSNIGFPFRSSIVYFLFRAFPHSFARKIHKKLA